MTTHELIARWAVAFVLTQLVECPIYFRAFGVRLPVAFAASAITHPIVVFAIWHGWGALYIALVRAFPGFTLGDDAYFIVYGVLGESFAVAAECAWLATAARLPLRRAMAASLVANAASVVVGLLASVTTGWP
jgi:uncharacterized membrane protein